MRISGPHNTVQGNYVSGCEFGIRVSCGEYTASALTPDYKPHLKHGAKKKGIADGLIATYPQVQDLTLNNNVTAGISGADLEMGYAYKKHWPEEQLVLIPERCLIKDNRFIRPQGGDSLIGTIPAAAFPLQRLRFEPNQLRRQPPHGRQKRLCSSGKRVPGGAASRWLDGSRRTGGIQMLTPAEVGPAWVIALGVPEFPMEDDDSCFRTSNSGGKVIESGRGREPKATNDSLDSRPKTR